MKIRVPTTDEASVYSDRMKSVMNATRAAGADFGKIKAIWDDFYTWQKENGFIYDPTYGCLVEVF